MTPPPASDGLMTGVATKTKEKAKAADERMHGEAPHNLRFLFWLAILVQIVDVFLLRFNRTTFLYTSIAMYITLTVFALLFFHKKGEFVNLKNIFIFALLSAFYIIIPFLLYAVPRIPIIAETTLFDWVNFLLAIFPLWPIYIGIKAEIPFVHKYVNFWIVFLLLLFIFGVSFNVQVGELVGIGGRPELLQAGAVGNYLWDKTREVVTDFWNSVRPVFNPKDLLNRTGLDLYYSGIIDDNEKEPVGLYLENVRLIDKYAYEGFPVTIWADIVGKSFMDEEIIVIPHCYIDKGEDGVTDPKSFSILGYEQDTLSCTFDNLSKGSYSAKIAATFNFETWAYVTYTFVDIETRRALELQGKNINYELDIDPYLRAVFTNGPVMLGMASQVYQPVSVDTRHNTREPVLGVTLDNRWTDGEIPLGGVDEFVIMVPDDFKLVSCDRWRPETEREPDESEEGYDSYRFKREEMERIDPRAEFQSVTCRLHINDPQELLGGAQKVQRTFITKAKYRYVLEKTRGIYVRE